MNERTKPPGYSSKQQRKSKIKPDPLEHGLILAEVPNRPIGFVFIRRSFAARLNRLGIRELRARRRYAMQHPFDANVLIDLRPVHPLTAPN